MKIVALPGKAIVECGERERPGGLLIYEEDATKHHQRLGKVVAVPDKSAVRVGDHVVFRQYTADVLEANGRTFHVVPEKDILFATDLFTANRIKV